MILSPNVGESSADIVGEISIDSAARKEPEHRSKLNDDEEDSKISDAVSTRPKEVGAGTTSRGNMVGRESKEEEVASSDNNNDDLLDLMDAL